VARGYADGEGHIIMLLVAYGASQSDRLQLHRPEICYGAQGFKVSRPAGVSLSYANGQPPISGTRLVASREGRLEPITYWMRIGNDVVSGVVERQILKVTYGLHGLIPDGTLIRISTVGMSEDSSFALQTRFVPEFIASLDPVARSLIVGDSAKALAFR
jgi:EpsI family protein